MAPTNHKFRLAARPVGMPKSSDWTYTEEPKPEFPTGIDHHQNNSFDEFRERGYARAHHEDVAL